MTPPQDSVSDVERLRAALAPFAAKADEIERVAAVHDCAPEKIGRQVDYAACVEARAALAVPINKIGKDAK